MATANPCGSKERQGENKSQICNFFSYFSRKGKKISGKCDFIGRNFKPCIMNFHLNVQFYLPVDVPEQLCVEAMMSRHELRRLEEWMKLSHWYMNDSSEETFKKTSIYL